MKKTQGVLRFLVVGLFAVTLLCITSSSQSSLTGGRFTLPFEAHWGKLNLQPGTYSFNVNSENSAYIIAVQQGNHPMGFVLATTFSSHEPSENPALLCVRHAGACSIGALKTQRGAFYFHLPSGSMTQMAQEPGLIERIPVLYAQK
jgi:hypothetical protein